MNKKTTTKIIFVLLILALILAVIFAIFSNKKDLSKKMYKDICEKANYTFSMEVIASDLKNKLTISKKENSICIDSISGDEHTSTLVYEQESFYINHNQEEYFVYEISQVDADILRNDLKEIEKQEYKTGSEKIENKTYYYEEFEGIDTFILSSNYNADEHELKTRFYFEKNKIAYIKTIIGSTEQELLKIDFSDNIDESLFEIPANYAEIKY